MLERLVDATTERRTRCENTVVVAIPWDDPVAAITQDALSKAEARKDIEGFYHRMYALYSSLIRITPVKGLNDNDNPAVVASAAAPITPMKSLSTPVKLETNSSAEPTATKALAGKDAAPEPAAELSVLAESDANSADNTAASHAEVARDTPAQTHDMKDTLAPAVDNMSKSTEGTDALPPSADPDTDGASSTIVATGSESASGPEVSVGDKVDIVTSQDTSAPAANTATTVGDTLSLASGAASGVAPPDTAPPVHDEGVLAPAETSQSTTEDNNVTIPGLTSEPDPQVSTKEASEAVSSTQLRTSQALLDAEETSPDLEEIAKAPADVSDGPVPNNTEVQPNKSESLPPDASQDATSATTSNEIAAKKASCEVVVDHVLNALLRCRA